MIPVMYFGVHLVWVMRDGRRLATTCAGFNKEATRNEFSLADWTSDVLFFENSCLI